MSGDRWPGTIESVGISQTNGGPAGGAAERECQHGGIRIFMAIGGIVRHGSHLLLQGAIGQAGARWHKFRMKPGHRATP